MIPDRLQYFLEYFWINQKLDWIWTVGPGIYYQNTSNNIRKVWEHPWNIIFHIWESEMFKIVVFVWNYCVPFSVGGILSISFVYYILRRWGSKNDKNCINQIERILDMNLIFIKNMKWTFGNFSIFTHSLTHVKCPGT